ncbi:hypothetical protein BX600DRAFT_506750 [Xylariales sp. PMI_506]|nr:hypothetical protein BX600DRAFT_506750 [Xylariales sp. PMI_506]
MFRARGRVKPRTTLLEIIAKNRSQAHGSRRREKETIEKTEVGEDKIEAAERNWGSWLSFFSDPLTMGWLWASTPSSSSSPPKASKDNDQPSAAPTPAQPTHEDPEIASFLSEWSSALGNQPSAAARPPPPPSAPPPSAKPAAAEETSSSWASFWGPTAQQSDTPSSSPHNPSHTLNNSTSATATANSHPQQGTAATLPQQSDLLDPISESLLPTTMSCRQALDVAFYCQSPGGQWNAVYRSGGARSCSEHWDDLWFCMRTRTLTGEPKAEAVRAHYRAKERAKYGPGHPSSTDVWEAREEKVAPGSVFQEAYESPDLSDEEWRTQEIRRRRAVQEALAAAAAANRNSDT